MNQLTDLSLWVIWEFVYFDLLVNKSIISASTEKSWKAMMPEVDGSKNEARSQHLNKHNKSQSQGLCSTF